jgi:hypothetical protein
MSAIAEGLFQRSEQSRQMPDFAVVALCAWAGLMLSVALINFGVDFTPLM